MVMVVDSVVAMAVALNVVEVISIAVIDTIAASVAGGHGSV